MIPLDKLKSITRLCTHASCPDGVASALIVKDALPNVRVSFMAYGTEEHRMLEPAPGVLFCDFTPWLPKLTDPRAQIVCEDGRTASITDKGVLALREDLIAKWREAGVLILDHHPTARDIVEAFGDNGVFGLNEKNECGAWLAYEHVWLPLEKATPVEQTKWSRIAVEDFARLAAIRDTWKKDSPDWQRACAQAAELVFWGERTSLGDMLRAQIGTLGQHLLDKQLSAAQRALEESHSFVTTRGTRVLVFQGVSTTSDAAEIADKKPGGCEHKNVEEKTIYDSKGNHMHCRDCGADWLAYPDLVVGFHYKVDAGKLKLQFSTRSHTGFDCAAFAKAHGGGGHKAAAGFTVEVSPEVSVNPYAMFRLLLEEWEGGQ